MGIDADHLGPGPDLDAVDFDKLDKGDNIVAPEAPPAEETTPAEEAPAEETAKEEAPEEEVKEEQPRDEKTGKFAKKEREHPDHIPKERFNEAVNKEREARAEAERKAAELEKQLREREQQERAEKARSEKVEALDKQIDDLEAKRDKLLMDGDKEKAAELNKQIRQMNREVARIEAQEESSQIVNVTLERERVEASIARLEADHDILNPRSESYDDDVVQMVLAMQRTMIEKGISPSKALTDSAEKIMKRLSKAEPEPEQKGLSQAQQDKIEERKKEAVKKSLDTQKAQPASTKDVGMDSDKMGNKALPDVTRMSVEEFNALPEATRARLRGDTI